MTVLGTVRSMTLRPRAGTPALEVELYDGSGRVTLVWLGRREIAGIAPGRQLRATGRITSDGARRVIFNPRYELVLAPAADASPAGSRPAAAIVVSARRFGGLGRQHVVQRVLLVR